METSRRLLCGCLVFCLSHHVGSTQYDLSWKRQNAECIRQTVVQTFSFYLDQVVATCLICQKQSLEKATKVEQGREVAPLAHSQTDHWYIDLIQLPKTHGYQYVLILICIFSKRVGASPCRNTLRTLVTSFPRINLPHLGYTLYYF